MLPLETFYPHPSAMNSKSHRALIPVLPGQKSRLVTRDPLDPVFIDASGDGTTALRVSATPGKADHRKLEAPVYRILINMGVQRFRPTHGCSSVPGITFGRNSQLNLPAPVEFVYLLSRHVFTVPTSNRVICDLFIDCSPLLHMYSSAYQSLQLSA